MPSHERRSRPPGRAAFPLRLALGLAIGMMHAALAAQATGPVSGLRVQASSLESPQDVQRAVSSAVADGFDALMVPVHPGTHNEIDAFDGASEVLRVARQHGLRAYLSVGVTIAAAVGELPAAREHVIYQHPEWLMVPRELAPDLIDADARSPAYLGRLSRWARANADRVGGLYLSPLNPDAVAYLVGAVAAVVQRYQADGVYLDAVDFPGSDFDYSRLAMDIFRARVRSTSSPAERARMDTVEAIDPFGYAEEFPEEWRRFREERLTQLLQRLREALAAVRPSMTIVAGAASDVIELARRDRFQDWPTWLDRGYIDRVGYLNPSTSAVFFAAGAPFPSGGVRLTRSGAGDSAPSR